MGEQMVFTVVENLIISKENRTSMFVLQKRNYRKLYLQQACQFYIILEGVLKAVAFILKGCKNHFTKNVHKTCKITEMLTILKNYKHSSTRFSQLTVIVLSKFTCI